MGHYESPQASVMDVLPEGVLCGSLGSNHEGYRDGGSFDL